MTYEILFEYCMKGPWHTAGIDTQYKIVETEHTRYVVYEYSNGMIDWIGNLLALPVKYSGYMVHSGFASLYALSREKIRLEAIDGLSGRFLHVTGFSHGGPLAQMLYRELRGYGVKCTTFGSPQPFFMERNEYEGVENVVVRGDLLAMLPPKFTGYSNIGKAKEIGPFSLPSVKRHYPSEYRKYLKGLGEC